MYNNKMLTKFWNNLTTQEIAKLSTKIIRGVNLTIPQTIKYLVKDGLTRNQITKKDLTFNENGRDSK